MNGFERYSKKTRRAVFLEEMEQVVPWAELRALIEPYYPKAGNWRPPVGTLPPSTGAIKIARADARPGLHGLRDKEIGHRKKRNRRQQRCRQWYKPQ